MSKPEEQEALYSDNMEEVQDMGGDNVAPGIWYHIRVSKVKTHEANGDQMTSKTSGQPMCQVNMVVQDEGPFTGKNITQFPSLQAHALAWLKSAYKAIGYNPGPGGHNPHRLLDGEFYIKTENEVYEGVTRPKIAPWHLKPLSDGRPLK